MKWYHRTEYRDGSSLFFAKRSEVVFIAWRIVPCGNRQLKCLCSAFDEEWFGPSFDAATRWAMDKLRREVPSELLPY